MKLCFNRYLSCRRAGLALVLAVLLAGCATIPVSGPVISEPRTDSTDNPLGGIDIAVGPPEGLQPAQIVDNFLLAMASYEPDYATARLYLTEAAGKNWHPEEQVRIYTNLSRVVISDDGLTAEAQATLVGEVNALGVYTPVTQSGGRVDEFTFALSRTAGGEWRISTPPKGLLLNRYLFTNQFQRLNAYFFDSSQRVLIADPRYVTRGDWLEQAIAKVLGGPSGRIREITADRPVVRLDPEHQVVISAGILELPLVQPLPPNDELSRLAIQILASLRQNLSFTGLRFSFDGQALRLPNADAGGVVPTSAVGIYDVVTSAAQAAAPLVGVRDSQLVRWDAPGREPQPVPGFGQTALDVTGLALSADGQRVAIVTTTALLRGAIGSSEQANELLTQPDLLRPQFDARGLLWAMGTADGTSLAWLIEQSTVTRVPVPALEGKTVRAFRLHPDGRRLAIVADVVEGGETRRVLGTAEVIYDGNQVTRIDGWSDIALVWEDTPIEAVADVAWTGASTVAVIASSGVSQAIDAVYFVHLDGPEIDRIDSPGEVPLVALASTRAGTQIVALDDQGVVYRYQDTHNWLSLGSDIKAVAFPA